MNVITIIDGYQDNIIILLNYLKVTNNLIYKLYIYLIYIKIISRNNLS